MIALAAAASLNHVVAVVGEVAILLDGLRGYSEAFGITKGIILPHRGPVRAPRAKRNNARAAAFRDRA